MSVPVITGRLQIENYRLESRKTDQSDGDSTSDADCVFLFANRNDAREASASVLPALGCYLGPKPMPRPCGCAIAQMDNKRDPATMVMINFLGAAAQHD